MRTITNLKLHQSPAAFAAGLYVFILLFAFCNYFFCKLRGNFFIPQEFG